MRVVKHPVSLRASGRTDAGVHAAGQTANFFTSSPIPIERIPHAVNSRLPRDIRIRRAEHIDDMFDSTLSVKSKLYRYRLCNSEYCPPEAIRYCYHYWYHCDIAKMQQACALLVGEHDFTSFACPRGQRQSNVRTIIRCQVRKRYHWMYFDLQANGFLYHMVRNIVGTLLDVGRGRWTPQFVSEILAARDRAAAGPMVPAAGLSLRWVKYD